MKYAPNNESIILSVARIAPYKNQFTLVRAIPMVIREIQNVRFIFAGPVGDSKYYKELCRIIAEEKVAPSVLFVGEIPHLEVAQLYSLASICAIPSQSEGFPLIVLEAMAFGKAIVASDFEAFTHVLNEGKGIIVPTFDHEAVGNAILTLLKNKPLREGMGQKAKEYVKANYTWENVAKKTIDVYESVLNGSRNR